MDFTIISGSERPNGNTDQVVAFASEYIRDQGCSVDAITLRDYRFAACGHCGDCNYRVEPCEINDNMPQLIERMGAAHCLIYVTPVHGFGMAHLMQSFIERAGVGYLRFRRPLANKVAGAIVTGRRYSHVSVHTQLLSNLLLNRMILVGSGYPAVVHGGKPGEAMEDTEGLEAVRNMIQRMISLARLLELFHAAISSDLLSMQTLNEREALPSPVRQPSTLALGNGSAEQSLLHACGSETPASTRVRNDP